MISFARGAIVDAAAKEYATSSSDPATLSRRAERAGNFRQQQLSSMDQQINDLFSESFTSIANTNSYGYFLVGDKKDSSIRKVIKVDKRSGKIEKSVDIDTDSYKIDYVVDERAERIYVLVGREVFAQHF